MKHKLILFPLLIAFTLQLQAQSETPVSDKVRQSEIGIHGGIHLSGFYGEQENEFIKHKSLGSYMAAVYYKRSISDRLYIGLELEHMHVKTNLILSESPSPTSRMSTTYDELFDLDYINLHFLFGRKLFFIKSTIISGTLSPYWGYLLRSEATGTVTESSSYVGSNSSGLYTVFVEHQYDIHETQTGKLRPANAGIGMSLDAVIPLGQKLSLLLKTTYNIGVYSVINRKAFYENAFIGIGGCVFSVGAVYKLR